MNPVLEAIFGNRTATLVLLFLEAYSEGHALRIANTFELGLSMTQRQLKRLEGNGVIESRVIGKTRLFTFNERNPTVKNLREFLKRELKQLPKDEIRKYFRQRQRPRRSGKTL